MTNEEAIRRIKARFDKWALDNEDMKAIQTLIPELYENEDEKIREFLIGILSQGTWRKEWPFSPNEVVAYLERQNHVQSDTEKEYVRTLKSLIFNFLSGKDEVDRDYYQQIEDWLDGRHVEQKEQEYTNVLEDAFKYYTDRGITISCGDLKAEPKKEQKPIEPSNDELQRHQNELDDFKIFAAKQAKEHHISFVHDFEWNNFCEELLSYFNEHEPAEWSEDFEENIRTLLHNKLTWHSEDGSMSSTVFIDDKTLKDIVSGIWFYVGKEALKYPNKEIHVSEWSEEDEGELQNAIDALEFLGKKGVYKSESGYDAALQAASWLKSIPERFNLQPKQEWSEEDEIRKESCILYLTNAKNWIDESSQYIGNNAREWGKEEIQKDIDWLLKIVRPQPHTVSIKNATKFGNLEYERGVKDWNTERKKSSMETQRGADELFMCCR